MTQQHQLHNHQHQQQQQHDQPVDVGVRLLPIEHVVLSHPNHQIPRRYVLKYKYKKPHIEKDALLKSHFEKKKQKKVILKKKQKKATL